MKKVRKKKTFYHSNKKLLITNTANTINKYIATARTVSNFTYKKHKTSHGYKYISYILNIGPMTFWLLVGFSVRS